MTKDQDDELVHEFLVESHENLQRLDHELVALERDPANAETLASVFRTIHTIKGTCGFLGFTKLETVAHRGESLLAKLRDGSLTLTPEIASALLALVDAVRQILDCVEHGGSEGDVDYALLLERLAGLEGGTPVRAGTVEDAHAAAADSAAAATPAARTPAAVEATAAGDGAHESQTSNASEGSIRVDLRLLERLMNLVGELVLTRNQVLQCLRAGDSARLAQGCQHLDLVTGELQEGILRTRMQPIASLWSRLPRLVRDVALACSKQVHLEMKGERTELDRALIEALKDPLTHLVRNAIDHGIEAPETRIAAGKPAEGRLRLAAAHESGFVTLEISDDGAGIDPGRLRERAVSRGLVQEGRAASLSEDELLDLIFLPGFSTADRVTSVSGRGVGMDVVRSNIERMGGAVGVRSGRGKGTRFQIKIPLTLAIIPALIVESGGDRYALPQSSLVELVRLGGDAAMRQVERIHEAPVVRLRDRLLPLVDLGRMLGAGGASRACSPAEIVVLRSGEHSFGVVVDAVHDTEEIVVKPLPAQLEQIPGFSGVTLLGDGSVALILDVPALARRSRVAGGAAEQRRRDPPIASPAEPAAGRYVIVRMHDDRRLAIPLACVERLEKLAVVDVERAGEGPVVRSRGRILPLVDPSGGLVRRPEARAGDTVHVVVCDLGAREAGLVVDRVLDVVEERLAVEAPGQRPGILGSAVVAGRVTEVVDPGALLGDAGAGG